MAMKIIICGCGQIGQSLVRYLYLDYEIVLIDQDKKILQEVQELFDIQPICGSASDPDILQRAKIDEHSVIVAVTGSDDVNIVACQMAGSFFKAALKVAYLRHESYFSKKWHEHITKKLGIDLVLSPEREAAQAILKSIEIHYAFDVFSLAGGKLQFLGIHASENSVFLGILFRNFSEHFPKFKGSIGCIIRNHRIFLPTYSDKILPYDEIYFLVETKHTHEVMNSFGFMQHPVKKLIIFGATRVGKYLIEKIEEKGTEELVLIDENQEKLNDVALQISDTLLMKGSPINPEVLEEAGIGDSQYTIAVTNNDTVNIIASLMAKRYGVSHPLALVTHTNYLSTLSSLGIEKMINPAHLTVALLLKRLSKEYVENFYPLEQYSGIVIEVIIKKTSPILKKSFSVLRASRINLLAIERRGKIFWNVESLKIGDHAILILKIDEYKKFKDLFEPK